MNPPFCSIAVWSLRPPTSGSTFSTLLVKSISGPQTLGTAMVMVDTVDGRRLAASVPGQDQVLPYDLTTPGLNPLGSGASKQQLRGHREAVQSRERNGRSTSAGGRYDILVATR